MYLIWHFHLAELRIGNNSNVNDFKLEKCSQILENDKSGGMGEWLKPTDLKSVKAARSSGVRIPLPPPNSSNYSCIFSKIIAIFRSISL